MRIAPKNWSGSDRFGYNAGGVHTSAKEHNDPFDRLLIAQAKVEKLSFLTHDSLIPGYNEKCVVEV